MACNTPLPAAWQLGSCASRCPTSPSPHVAHFGAGGSATSPRRGARSRVPVAVGTFRTQPGGAGEHGEIPVLTSCSRRAHSSVPRAGGDFRPPSLALGTSLTNIRGLAGGGNKQPGGSVPRARRVRPQRGRASPEQSSSGQVSGAVILPVMPLFLKSA